MKLFLFLALLLAIVSSQAIAEEAIVKRRVLTPDGLPIKGANVLIRRMGADGRWHDTRVKTNADGIFSAVIEKKTSLIEYVMSPDFALINARGYALYAMRLISFARTTSKTSSSPPKVNLIPEVNLLPEYAVRGQVLDADGVRVANADVSIVSLYKANFYDNYSRPLLALGDRHTPPELTTHSDKNGNFVLRGVSGGQDFEEKMGLVATSSRESALFLGQGSQSMFPSSTEQAGIEQPLTWAITKPLIIRLQRTHTVSGRVLNGVTGKPFKRARVRLGCWSWLPSPASVVTSGDGKFEFKGIPSARYVSLSTQSPNFSFAQIRLFDDEDVKAFDRSHSNLVLKIHPLVDVRVTLQDVETGNSPVVPLGLFAALIRGHTKLDSLGEQQIFFRKKDNASSVADGTFSMLMAAGINDISLAGIGSEEQAYSIIDPAEIQYQRRLNISDTKGQEILVKIKRKRGLLLKIEPADPTTLKDTILYIRVQGRTEDNHPARSGYVFRDGYKLGDKITVRAVRGDKEVLPPTEIITDPRNWPFVIQLP